MHRRLRIVPALSERPDGTWEAEYVSYGLKVRAKTRDEAIERLKRAAEAEKHRDPDSWYRRIQLLFETPGPDCEVVEDDGRGYQERVEQLRRKMNEDA